MQTPDLPFMRLSILLICSLLSAQNPPPVKVTVDLANGLGPHHPIHHFFGYDEPNYTYMRDGQKLLSALAEMNRETVHVRMHNLLTSGDGAAALKWGSTNAYSEDSQGRPVYDWTIVDRIFDTLIERGMKPLVEVGFMPEALSVKPQPYRHQWSPERPYNSIYTGWAHPPRDYAKWAGLLQAWVRHCIERYGRQEVASWYWEIWNEPDIGYWQSTTEEYLRLYDYSADAIKRVLPEIRIGGPTTTGPGSPKAAQFLRDFLEHAARGRNYATGRTGSPLDYITFHAKGRPKVVDGHVQMGSEFQLRDIDRGFAIVASFPEWKHLPIILGESDPEGCAACSVRFHPQNAYRNGTMYSSYTAATFAKKYELALRHGIRLEGAVTWAFEFEGQPYFDGFRDLATNGIAKPVLNVFRMFGLMSGERVQAESTGSVALDAMLASGVKGQADVGVTATRGARQAHVLLWHYHDDDVAGPPAEVSVDVKGFSPGVDRILLEHFRVDENYSNAYTAWLAMGSPQSPTPEQHSKLERAGLLESISPPSWRPAQDGSVRLQFPLPRQAVSLLRLSW